jgi:PEP-CTERM motif
LVPDAGFTCKEKIVKKLSSLVCALGAGLAFAGTAQADVINDWYFNPNGGGYAAAQQITEYLDINGNAFIQLAPISATEFSFTEAGVFNSVQADSNGQLFPVNYAGGNISATFNAVGGGIFGNAFAFSSGSISVYQNPANGQYGSTLGTYGADLGNLIATFDILPGGGGLVDASGTPLSNGMINVYAQASWLADGYFFDPLGNDLAGGSILAFAFTNANTIGSPNDTQVNEIICGEAGWAGDGCNGNDYSNLPGDHLFVSNNGQFKLAVPEPGSLALLGISLLGLATVRRRK